MKKAFPFIAVVLATLLTGCEPEQNQRKSSGGSDNVVDDIEPIIVPMFEGFWDGETVEPNNVASPLTTRLYMQDGEVFVLRDDQAMYGDVEVMPDGRLELDVDIFPFLDEDDSNQAYVAQNSNVSLQIPVLILQDDRLVANYLLPDGTYGDFEVMADGVMDDDLDIDDVAGDWQSVDGELFVNDSGVFIGNIHTATIGCQFEGFLIDANPGRAILDLEITRQNCVSFNVTAEGYAVIDSEGHLEFYARENLQLLFMKFEPVIATIPTGTDTGTSTSTGTGT